MDLVERILKERGEVVDDQQEQQQTAMDASGEYTVSAPEPEPAELLTGAVGARMKALVEKRRAAAMAEYVRLVRRLAQGKPLDDDEVVALADATRALGYATSRPDADVEVVRQYERCQAAGKQHAKGKAELPGLVVNRDKAYAKLQVAIEQQRRLGAAVSELEEKLRFLEMDIARGVNLLGAHPELLT